MYTSFDHVYPLFLRIIIPRLTVHNFTAFFFKINCEVKFMLPMVSRVWDHPLESGWPIEAYTLRKLSPLSAKIVPQWGVRPPESLPLHATVLTGLVLCRQPRLLHCGLMSTVALAYLKDTAAPLPSPDGLALRIHLPQCFSTCGL